MAKSDFIQQLANEYVYAEFKDIIQSNQTTGKKSTKKSTKKTTKRTTKKSTKKR